MKVIAVAMFTPVVEHRSQFWLEKMCHSLKQKKKKKLSPGWELKIWFCLSVGNKNSISIEKKSWLSVIQIIVGQHLGIWK